MSFLGDFIDFLHGPVGNAPANNPDDVKRTKEHLRRGGYIEGESENGYMTAGLDKAIRVFQRAQDLKEDGTLYPGGETEREIFKVLTRRDPAPYFQPAHRTSGSIGFGGNVLGTLVQERDPEGKKGPPPPPLSGSVMKDGKLILSLSGKNTEDTAAEERTENKPVEYDATGRMVRDKVSGSSYQEPNSPKGYDREEYLDKIEKTYREYVKIGREKKLSEAADNLEHFLNGSGDDKILSREKAREKSFVRDGESTNRKRFEGSFRGKGKTASKILELNDGETINVRDNWDYKVGYLPKGSILSPSRSHLLRGDMDEALSTGTSFVKSEGDFQARRKENIVFIEGVVSHGWGDRYDFDPMQSGGGGAVALERAGRAKNFDIKSNWKQKVYGTVEIKDGKLVDPHLSWKDISPKKKK